MGLLMAGRRAQRDAWTGSARISPKCTSIAEFLRETFGGGMSKSMIVPDKLDDLLLNAMGSSLMWAGGSFEEVAADGDLGGGVPERDSC